MRRLVSEVPVLLAEAELTPRREGGQIRGIRIENLPDQTLLSEAGLMPGDILLTLNEVEVDSLSQLIALYARLGSEGEIRLELLRGGERLSLACDLTTTR